MRNPTRAALAAAPLSLALLLAACGSDDDSADPTTTTTTETTTASSATTAPPASSETTAPPPASETTAPPETAPPDETPANTAVALVQAWGAGDREGAGRLATPEVVGQLFAHADPGGGDWEVLGCDGAAGSLSCTFTSASRSETLTTRQANMPDEATGELPPIDFVELAPAGLGEGVDEAALGDAASALVRAWGAGDREEATAHAHPEVVADLFDRDDPGGPDWDLRDCLMLTGTTPVCIFYDPGRDQRLLIGFDCGALPDDVVITSAQFRDGVSG